MEDIFDLAVSKREREFVESGVNLELEVTADIMGTFSEIPYIGSLIRFGQLANRFQDLHFIRKLAKFLEKGQDVPDETKLRFLDGLTSKQRKKLYEYVTHYLLRAEDDSKADIMGYIYIRNVFMDILMMKCSFAFAQLSTDRLSLI